MVFIIIIIIVILFLSSNKKTNKKDGKLRGDFHKIDKVQGYLSIDGNKINTYSLGSLDFNNMVEMDVYTGTNGSGPVQISDIVLKGESLYNQAPSGLSYGDKASYALHLLKKKFNFEEIPPELVFGVEVTLLEIDVLNYYIANGDIVREFHNEKEVYYWVGENNNVPAVINSNYRKINDVVGKLSAGNRTIYTYTDGMLPLGNDDYRVDLFLFDGLGKIVISEIVFMDKEMLYADAPFAASYEEKASYAINLLKRKNISPDIIKAIENIVSDLDTLNNYLETNKVIRTADKGFAWNENREEIESLNHITIEKKEVTRENLRTQLNVSNQKQYNYSKQRHLVDSLVIPHMSELYEQFVPAINNMLDEYVIEARKNSYVTQNGIHLELLNRLYVQHFFLAFVNGWKKGYFSLGQVVEYETILDEELEQITDELLNDALNFYSFEVSSHFLIFLEKVWELGIESGGRTNIQAS